MPSLPLISAADALACPRISSFLLHVPLHALSHPVQIPQGITEGVMGQLESGVKYGKSTDVMRIDI